jgi:EAL domain-containing protein (putative c-di-GMP-specific phosphodiesterase class I)
MKHDDLADQTHNIELALLSVINTQKIDLVYQGQYKLPMNQLVGLEALCRIPPGPWGDVLPDQFIPMAEEIGLITQFERVVLKQIALDLPQLVQCHPHLQISINLSIRHVSAPDFSMFIHGWLDALSESIIAHLDFEITETYFQLITPAVVDSLQTLRKRGVRIVMDDFGSGQSNLSRLHTLPFDVIKLDKQFAQQIDHSMVCAIVKATVALTQEFGIGLIAEGVETAKQAQSLQDVGCYLVQGYFFSHPQPIAHWL